MSINGRRLYWPFLRGELFCLKAGEEMREHENRLMSHFAGLGCTPLMYFSHKVVGSRESAGSKGRHVNAHAITGLASLWLPSGSLVSLTTLLSWAHSPFNRCNLHKNSVAEFHRSMGTSVWRGPAHPIIE